MYLMKFSDERKILLARPQTKAGKDLKRSTYLCDVADHNSDADAKAVRNNNGLKIEVAELKSKRLRNQKALNHQLAFDYHLIDY
ncbi:uncharacterized protein [Nicotiana tomentosiformis]|uniref:uncharacterized protein n=1 Tax=Nicotiana tomentosiformis TaxID=4098 RepID=UPI00388C9707